MRGKERPEWLPEGWRATVKKRRDGKSDWTYINLSTGSKLYSKMAVFRYLESEGLHTPSPNKEGRIIVYSGADTSSSQRQSVDNKFNNNTGYSSSRLPDGWIKEFKLRKAGSKVKKEPYYVDPVSGYAFRSRKDAFRYIATGNVNACVMKPKVDSSNKYSIENVGSIVKQPDGPVTRKKFSSRAIKRKPTVRVGDSPKWLPSGWITEIRTQQSGRCAGRKYKCFFDPVTDTRFYSKRKLLEYLESEEIHSPLTNKETNMETKSAGDMCSSLTKKETSMETKSAGDICTSSNQIGRANNKFTSNTSSSSYELPDGWIKIVRPRKSNYGVKKDPYYIDPVSGYEFRSRKDAWRYIESGDVRRCTNRTRKRRKSDIYSIEKEDPMASACPSASEADPTKKAVHAVWSTDYDHVFMDILIEHANMGSLQSNFTTGIENAIFAEFLKRTNKSFDSKQIRTKYFTLKRQYKNFKRLIGHTGFDWDPKTNIVTPNNDVWDEYLKAKPFERNGCPDYSKLYTIFGEKAPTGQGAAGIHSVHASRTPEITNLDKDDLPETPIPPPPRIENDDQSTQVNRSAARRQQSGSMVDSAVVRSPDIPNEQPVTKVAKKTPSASPSTSTPGSDNPFSMTNCISELKKMNGLPKSIQIKAISALTVEVWREAFMSMDSELREAWLESLEPGFKLFKPAPTCHGKAPDVLNEMIPSSGDWENVKIVQPENVSLDLRLMTGSSAYSSLGL